MGSLILALGEVATPTMPDWSTLVTNATFQPLVNGIIGLIPVMLGVSISFIAIKKGLIWVKGAIKKA